MGSSFASDAEDTSTPHGRIGLRAGLFVAATILVASYFVPPETVAPSAMRLLAVTALVSIWWFTQALPMGATSLIPAALFPVLGVATAKQVAPAYASPHILLLLGGFLLAMAVEHSGVHRRLALKVLVVVGTEPRRLVLGALIATASISLWISNTATTLILMPIALAIADRALDARGPAAQGFAASLLLATAYGSSVGGMGTPVGTPPNVIAMGVLGSLFPDGPSISFVEWMIVALPAVIVIVPAFWLVLTRVYPRVPANLDLGASDLIRSELASLGPWRPVEIRAVLVFAAAAVAWVTRPDLPLGAFTIPGWQNWLELKGVDDGTIALLAASVAFVLPSGAPDRSRLLPWSAAVRVPWGLVLMFGGGMAISDGFERTGLSAQMGATFAGPAEAAPTAFFAISSFGGTFITEVISNTALANLLLPILGATAKAAALDPRLLILPVAMACSCAFMLPAGTAPNAIVLGTGKVSLGTMIRAGLFCNLVAWAAIVLANILAFS